jgi:hypothetical protein
METTTETNASTGDYVQTIGGGYLPIGGFYACPYGGVCNDGRCATCANNPANRRSYYRPVSPWAWYPWWQVDYPQPCVTYTVSDATDGVTYTVVNS